MVPGLQTGVAPAPFFVLNGLLISKYTTLANKKFYKLADDKIFILLLNLTFRVMLKRYAYLAALVFLFANLFSCAKKQDEHNLTQGL